MEKKEHDCTNADCAPVAPVGGTDPSRRNFLQGALAAGAASLGAMGASSLSHAQTDLKRSSIGHYYVPATDKTVHWGYFSKNLKPLVVVESGDFVTIETLTHHANDDAERMVKATRASVFCWDKTRKGVNRRRAGPWTPCSGAVQAKGWAYHLHRAGGVKGAQPGDILEVRILDVKPRPCANPKFVGKTFGSNAAAWWGYHYNDMVEEPKKREVITIYEVDPRGERNWARALYNFRWTPQTDPFGVVHKIIDYPGVPVDHTTIKENWGVLKNVRVPIRPHFGTMGLAPAEANMVDSIPPSYTGGNIDDWRIGKGATMYYPVSVEGGLLSVGDPHASQGDSELCGTAIECSLTGTFQLILHKKASLAGGPLENLNYPLLETKDEFVVHGFTADYLAELGPKGVHSKSSTDLAMRDAFRKMRHFLMSTQGLGEDEAVSLLSVGVDFGVTQVVDGNWGVHAIVKKAIFAGGEV
jgi:acetamidase/formamidase